MATKKEKRARAEAKRAEEMEALRLSGLRAQSQDRARRAARGKQAKEITEKEYSDLHKLIEDNETMPFGQAVPGA